VPNTFAPPLAHWLHDIAVSLQIVPYPLPAAPSGSKYTLAGAGMAQLSVSCSRWTPSEMVAQKDCQSTSDTSDTSDP
jgi:hypothetical protein